MTIGVGVDITARLACEDFLHAEAEALDERRLYDWLGLLAQDVEYRVPIRVTRERRATLPEFSSEATYLTGDLASLRGRVSRFDTEYAWAEDPPSRVRRFVSNIRVRPAERPAEWSVRSNLLVFRARGEDEPALVSCERHDVLRQTSEGLRLARRTVLLDHTSLPWENLAIFL